jgi:hypothetical protein
MRRDGCGVSRTIVSCRLKDAHALRNCCASEALIIWRVDGRQERDVHTERFIRLSSGFANGIAQCVGVRLSKRREDTCGHVNDAWAL